MNLYELMGEYAAIQDACYHEETSPEELDALLVAMDEAKGSLRDKVDNVVRVLRNLSSDAQRLKQEEQRLTKRRRSLEASVERLREWIRSSMDLLDVDKIKTELHTVSLGKHTTRVVILSIDEVPEQYRVIKIEANKSMVLEAFSKDGEIVPGTDVIQGPRVLTIR